MYRQKVFVQFAYGFTDGFDVAVNHVAVGTNLLTE
jgi:hypothetical protein